MRQVTKRRAQEIRVTESGNEQHFRQQLAQRISGTHLGIWLLTPFLLKLDAWGLLQSWIGKDLIQCRMGLQMVHEAAICVNRVRAKDTLCHQGFAQAHGLSFLATDEAIHGLCSGISMEGSFQMQIALAKKRQSLGHYQPQAILAIDPHRIPTHSQRLTPKKKKKPGEKATKTLQTFFCNDALNGQPFGFTIGSAGVNCTKASLDLIQLLEQLDLPSALLLADTEHYTIELLHAIALHPRFDIIVPAPANAKMNRLMQGLTYKEHWPGYAIATAEYRFDKDKPAFLLIAQRTGLKPEDFIFKGFLSTSSLDAFIQVNQLFPKRWTIEEFFNFEADLGWNRASTLNLNIRYAKLSAALIAQAACFQIKQCLPQPFNQWTAQHLAKTVLLGLDASAHISNDTITITCYNVPPSFGLHHHFSNLPQKLLRQGINPNVPWLFDFKLDFVFL